MVQETGIEEPNFIIDDEGRVYCTKHTEFNKPKKAPSELLPPILNLFSAPQPAPLTCKTCGHYFNDSCYFSPESINQIMYERDRGQIICEFCGERITRSMSVFQKIYYENKFRVQMPLVCCGCYAALKNDNFIGQAKKNMLWWAAISIGSLIACFYYLSLLFVLIPWGAAAIIFGLFFWAYFSYNYIRKIYYTWKGKKRYEALEAKLK
jgi:hypothetical protein